MLARVVTEKLHFRLEGLMRLLNLIELPHELHRRVERLGKRDKTLVKDSNRHGLPESCVFFLLKELFASSRILPENVMLHDQLVCALVLLARRFNFKKAWQAPQIEASFIGELG